MTIGPRTMDDEFVQMPPCSRTFAKKRARRTRHGLSVALGGALVLGCPGPDVPIRPDADTSSSSGAGADPSTDGAPTPSSDGGTSAPTREPLPPFELPEGCGDGVVVPGQFDCFHPVPIDWIAEELAKRGMGSPTYQALDLELDGRDELVAARRWDVSVIRWEDGELHLGTPVNRAMGISGVQTRWDWTGDGLPDLTLLTSNGIAGSGRVSLHPNVGSGELGTEVVAHEQLVSVAEGAYGVTGMAAPIDVDGDGFPEVLVAQIVDGIEYSNPLEELTLYRRVGDQWQQVGESFPFYPCGWLSAFAYGDFDGDGDEDIAVLDPGTACDPFPPEYDPEWYRVWVLLSDAEAGVLTLGGWYPTGERISDDMAIWAEDVDGDRHLDLVVRAATPVACEFPSGGGCLRQRVTLMRGHGDGAFDEGTIVDLEPALGSYQITGIGDLDGDGTREWTVALSDGRPWVIPLDFSKQGIAPLVTLNDPDDGWVTISTSGAVGDINGDGIDDFLAGTYIPFSGGSGQGFLMVSAP
jgi:hypothetical protein